MLGGDEAAARLVVGARLFEEAELVAALADDQPRVDLGDAPARRAGLLARREVLIDDRRNVAGLWGTPELAIASAGSSARSSASATGLAWYTRRP
ncbi:hypothetical protein [Nannocystis pusilla]|uniref:hypothetical protein n=1 Tax=Nannocystis pusilla TaxID=889268 RepID=UPI003B7E3CF3